MKTLILDSATNILYTALVIDDHIVYESYVKGKTGHATSIMTEVEKAINTAGIELLDLNRVIVGNGPGSYTGVRMAVTVGKMITTLESKIQLYIVSTLVLMGSAFSGRIMCSIDARRGNCFGCIYDFDSSKFIVEEQLIERNVLLENDYDNSVDENDYKVNPLVVIKLANAVEEPRCLVPNYLRDTEAERDINVKTL